MTQLSPYALNNANTEQKKPTKQPKTKVDALKENHLKAHRQPLSASIRNLICSTPGSLFKYLCHSVFSRKPHHLPSQWVTGVSQNHRATFQAKFIFQGSSHYSESGRTEALERPGMWQCHRSCCLQLGRMGPGLLPSNTVWALCCLCFSSPVCLLNSLHNSVQGRS